MAPVPQEHVEAEEVIPDPMVQDDEAIVITGMSGIYPQSHSVKDLSDILYEKKNPINADRPRWQYYHPELPQFLGKVPQLKTFDAQFFKVHYRLGVNMDPMSRKLLEKTFEAIYDAGVSPQYLSGKKVGVYIGSCFSETEKASFYVASIRTGFGIAGCSKAMFANRISYWLNLKGPSMSIDATCASSMIALERAYEAINSGQCEAAIVGGANICLHPQSSLHYGRTMTLCMDGKTKSFDKNADGCARSDAINVLFLQKMKDANRVYARVCYVKTGFGPVSNELGQKYGPYRDEHKLTTFFKGFYDEIGVSPSHVEYVEAFGAAIPESDKSELEAISNVFCKDRNTPLMVGSVTSNIGYTEAAAGISSITKVLLGYHTGKIAGNLHCDNPRDDVMALADGRMRIVTDHQPFLRTYTAVNNISLSGINLHVLLHGQYKPKDLSRYHSNIPHLVAVSGRQESGVKKILDDLKSRPVDAEEIGLFHNIHESNITGHLGRGFTILGTNEEGKTVSLVEKVDYCDDARKPLWFVYSGMGSQWAGMGAQLMRIPVFAAAIERCRVALEPKGVDIVHIITSPEKEIFDNILHSFVGIAAIQIGLTDVLRELGIFPDKIIGHSVGELGCAYADGCFTAEEMILSAYSRGLVSVQTAFIRGSMAAIGLGYNKIKDMLPAEIEVACHNASNSSTISGPADVMKEFVAKLTEKGIFAKEVPCSNIAYHSRYIQEAGPGLLKYLSEVIKSPKKRSDRWVSTSVPKDKWENTSAQYSSAEYHTNNLLNPVLFEETSVLVPANAVLIEVAPHGLLQAILKRSLPASCVHVPLTRRGHADNALFLLEAVGKLYMQGYNPKMKALYPKIEFPVSTGTPMLSHHIEWAHHETWTVPLHLPANKRTAAASKFIISVHDDEHKFIRGNVHGNEMLYPFSGALVCVWDTLAMSLGAMRHEISVQFQNVHLHAQPRVYEDKLLRLNVQLQKGSGYFECIEGNTKLITGYIYTDATHSTTALNLPEESELDEMTLESSEVYKIFHDRGSYYSGEFRSIKSMNADMTRAQVSWSGNWITLIDSMIQMTTLHREYNGVSHPRFIRRLIIDTKEHNKYSQEDENEIVSFESKFCKILGASRCGGVSIEDIRFVDHKPSTPKPVLKALKFIPYFQLNNVEINKALYVYLQIVAENMNKNTINVVEIQTQNSSTFEKEIHELRNSVFRINYSLLSDDDITNYESQILRNADMIVVRNLATSDNMCEMLYSMVPKDIFLLSTESTGTGSVPQAICRVVASAPTSRGRLVLARWRPASMPVASAAVSVSDESDLALLRSARQSLRPNHRLVVLSSYPPPRGLKELVQTWRKETDRNKIYVAMINHRIAKDQHLEQLPNFDLAFNVLDHGAWGGDFFVQSEENIEEIGRNVTLQITKPGNLDMLHWKELSEPVASDIVVKVHYAGLNIQDAKRATGVVPFISDDEFDQGYGMDFSGITKSGDRVMGIVPGGAASSLVAAEPALLWPVPEHWSLEDAATVPLPYAHAFYCLGIKCELLPGMTILVHGATGALGLACISIALGNNCKVFATVSDQKKKRFLRRLFPNLPENHIGNSRDCTFSDMVISQTKGKKCDVVICSLEGEMNKNEAFNCLRISGILVDTNQIPCRETYQFGMQNLTHERNYYRVDFSAIFTNENNTEMKEIQFLLSEGVARGYVRPLSRVSYDAHEASRAFRLLAASRHRGRVLLNLQGKSLTATPRLTLSPAGSQLVISSFSDETVVGNIIDGLIERGAKKIMLHRQQKIDGYMQIKIKKWQDSGVDMKISNVNLTNMELVCNVVQATNNLGPVEGIYLITTGIVGDRTQADLAMILDNFDVVTRKISVSVKHFVVINENNNIGQEQCLSRAFDRLPSTMLTVPKLNKFYDGPIDAMVNEDNGWSGTAVVEAMDLAVRSKSSVLRAEMQSYTPQLLSHIANIAGININECTSDTVTLEQLGCDPEKSEAVSNYLSDNFSTVIAVDDILKLSISRIRELERQISAKKEGKATGLQILYSQVDPDELMGSHELVFVPSLTHEAALREDEFDCDETYFVMIPGLEGHHRRFHSLCERLKLPTVVIQPGLDHPYETVNEMAVRLAKVILKKLQPKKKFYLLGYSFGVLVALEIASILEEHGLEGVVYCVDGSPETFGSALEAWLSAAGATDEERLQDALVQHMYALMTGPESSASASALSGLRAAHSWRDKVEVCVAALRGRVSHSAQYARALIETAHARIETARRYDAERLRTRPLRSQLVVMRCSAVGGDDLGLSRYSVRAPLCYTLQADHATALEDLRVANIVNRHLHTHITDTFLKRNLCETYLLNASSFMGNCDEIDME